MPAYMRAVSLILSCCLLACAVTVSAQDNGRDMEREKVILQQLAASAPQAVESFRAATAAVDREDYAEAARLYEEVLKQAPDFDPVYRRLGSAKVMTGEREEGMALLETAVQKQASPENMITLAQFLYDPGENREASVADKARAFDLTKRAFDGNQHKDPAYAALLAQMALESDKLREFREATEMLVRKHPDYMLTHYFNGIRAAMDEDWIAAENEIRKAQALGLPTDEAERILSSGIHTRATVWRFTWYTLYLTIAWALGLLALFVLGKLMSNRTLRSIETTDPNAESDAQGSSLRQQYRRLINIAGAYYYISLPVVMLLVVALTGSIFYAFLMIGRIPIKLALILGIGAVVTLWKMVTSFFIKTDAEDPGRSLKQEEAPGLWALTREVAQAVDTRPIDEIRITPGTDLAVYEKGSYRERMQDQAKRILILGTATLNGFSQNAFRAVLAHEYGHFSNRDTAGGDVALRVNNDMMKFAYAMGEKGQAVWWNLAWQFLRLYHILFRRITHGATRLQEVMADRVAALNYGGQAFEEGLRHVIARSVEFDHLASIEINAAVREQRALQNLYQLPSIEGTPAEQGLREAINEALNSPTTEDNTHPGPMDRFRYVNRIVHRGAPPATGMVWDLFADPAALTAEMSDLIGAQIG